jgi:hypothetical protein
LRLEAGPRTGLQDVTIAPLCDEAVPDFRFDGKGDFQSADVGISFLWWRWIVDGYFLVQPALTASEHEPRDPFRGVFVRGEPRLSPG